MNQEFNPLIGLEFERNFSLLSGEYFFDPASIEKFWNSFNGKIKLDPSSNKPIGTVFTEGSHELILVNDTGYSEIEFPTDVFNDLNIHSQLFSTVFNKAIKNLKEITKISNLTLFCTGSHPTLEPSIENYYKYRTPKGSLYSLICEGSQFVAGRQWEHQNYINLTSDQINIDLPINFEFELIKSLHRIMSILVGVSANSAFENGKPSGYKSIRQLKQYQILNNPYFEIEKEIVGMPQNELKDLNQVFDILFNQRPILFIGKGKESKLLVPQTKNNTPPTLTEYLSTPEWQGVSIDGEKATLHSSIEDIQSPLHRISFWNIKPQLNFSHSAQITTEEFLSAAKNKTIHTLLNSKRVKTFIEVRSIDAALPGEEICMPAFIKGLTINFRETIKFSNKYFSNYKTALESYFLAAKHGINFKHNNLPINHLGQELLEIAEDGLRKINNGTEVHFLQPLKTYFKANQCPSDKLLDLYDSKGIKAVYQAISLTQKNEN
jgi:hypothetical protein